MWSKIWLDRVKELKKERGMSSKQIAERAGIAERTVNNVLSGDSDAPRVDSICPIVYALGGSLDDIFATPEMPFESPIIEALKTEIATHLATIDQFAAQNALHAEDVAILNEKINLLTEENAIYKDKVKILEDENNVLRIKLDYEGKIATLQKELIEQHHYYTQLNKEG